MIARLPVAKTPFRVAVTWMVILATIAAPSLAGGVAHALHHVLHPHPARDLAVSSVPDGPRGAAGDDQDGTCPLCAAWHASPFLPTLATLTQWVQPVAHVAGVPAKARPACLLAWDIHPRAPPTTV